MPRAGRAALGRAVIDLHSHILPGIDDGALNDADSIGMGRQADDDGVELVCATPHIRADHDVRIREIADRVERLNGVLAGEGVRARVLAGGEVAEPFVGGLTNDELREVSLGGGGTWILLEPAAGPLGAPFVRTVAQLAQRGFRALVAHPERHFDAQSIGALTEATEHGALVQVTAAALADAAPDEAPVELARRGLLHVLASDSHSSRYGRPLRLSAGLARLREIETLSPHLDWIAREAPRAIVSGDAVSVPFASG
jgi:protein-tyrosine phosphatase